MVDICVWRRVNNSIKLKKEFNVLCAEKEDGHAQRQIIPRKMCAELCLGGRGAAETEDAMKVLDKQTHFVAKRYVYKKEE
jgi:hypothetical protein